MNVLNHNPKLKPDWKKWKKAKTISLLEGVALSLNIDPKHITKTPEGGYLVAGAPVSEEFIKRLELVVAAADTGLLERVEKKKNL